MINSLRGRDQWIEAFFVQSLIWAFATLFKDKTRRKFIDHVQRKVIKNLINRETLSAAADSKVKVTSDPSSPKAGAKNLKRLKVISSPTSSLGLD